MPGNAAGRITLYISAGCLTSRFSASFKYVASTFFTAETVERSTGKNAAIKIITMAGMLPIPNQSTINGVQATGATGLNTCTIGSATPHNLGERPKINPSTMATTTARPYPVKNRYKLTTICSNSVPSSVMLTIPSPTATGMAKALLRNLQSK